MINKPKSVYKIRNTITGLYSLGGSDANRAPSRWSKNGKVWNGLGPLRNHLNGFLHEYGGGLPETWEVLELQYVEIAVAPARDMINPTKIFEILSR